MVDYWHGSNVVLPVGTRLTSLRERKGSAWTSHQYQYVTTNDFDPDRIYFTTDRELARAWCMRSKGALLLVDPVGPVEPDPDFPATSFSAPQAIVRDVAEHPVRMSFLAARKAFAAYQADSFDENGFIRPDVRLADMLAASCGDAERFRIAGRYPNPMRFSLRDRRIRYLTDDLELLVTINLLENYGPVSEKVFQTCLAEARASWPAPKPMPWL